MTDAVVISIVTGTASVIASGLAAWISHRTHKIVNSSNELWKKVAEEKYNLAGEKKGAEDERNRQREQSG